MNFKVGDLIEWVHVVDNVIPFYYSGIILKIDTLGPKDKQIHNRDYKFHIKFFNNKSFREQKESYILYFNEKDINLYLRKLSK